MVKRGPSRWLTGAVMLAMMDVALVATADLAVTLASTVQAQAQYRDAAPYGGRQRSQRPGGFFDQLFGGNGGQEYFPAPREFQHRAPAPVDSSHAPPPKKPDTTPTLSIMVMGDSMADWLAYGLEDAFSDAPEIGILRRSKLASGLLRYDARSELDWWHVARDNLTKDKADFVVMILGVNDRQPFRESSTDKKPAKEKDKEKDAAADKKEEPAKQAAAEQKPGEEEQPSILAPEPRSAGGAKGVTDFRTERWEETYNKRIDETIAALKSKGVPVIWVGLPPIRGTRSTADVQYLNDLYRARAEKAGIVYVDVWDGFVDDAGKFTYRGPDFEGQVRNLRSSDGVHFTKYGARKIAHYVERELRRFIANKAAPIALPADTPAGPMTPDGRPGATVRPVAGPVVPLTVAPGSDGDELLGGNASRPAHADPTATSVLVKGEPVEPPPGRADDFAWPRPGDANAIEPLSATAATARAEPDKPGDKNAGQGGKKAKAEAKIDAKAEAKPKPKSEATKPAVRPLRPAQPLRQQRTQGGPFGWLR